jgi:YbgC/YbaW family acyl-CoA thioester hydrolase
MSDEIATYALKIREHHLDTFGHVNNAVYLELFEEARWEIVAPRGYDMKKIKESGQGPVILDIHIVFMRELRLRSDIKIHTQLESYEGKIGILKQWIVDESGQSCCEAKFKVGLFDLKTRKLIPPTKEWLAALGRH